MNLVYGWCIERVEKRDEWDLMLEEPFKGAEKAKPTPFQTEDEGEAFMATLAMHQRVSGT
jgi:hypothetical protein